MPRNVLFLCTGNSARSLLAEAILERACPTGRARDGRRGDSLRRGGRRGTRRRWLRVVRRACHQMLARIERLLVLPLDAMDQGSTQAALDAIGRMTGATPGTSRD